MILRAMVLSALAAIATSGVHPAVDPDLLAGLKARAIGPAGMSGRVAAIDVSPRDPSVIWIGAATGGVWKSVNDGLTWEPVFDDQAVAAIGAIAVSPANPDVVWVGTGEGNPRNSASVGNGVYLSLDAGETWTHVGLDGTERIHRILPHPTDPDVAWVAALGQAWGENPERGVYRTTDRGKTWERVLYVDDSTGAADLAMDPSNPDKLIAALWTFRRWPWFFRSGGPGSGLYVTVDGGDSWERRTEADGLPAGELGRMGVAFCRSHPEIVYAVVEAEESALIRSQDGGRTWVRVNREPDVAPRPFYFADIRVDPEWPNRVYSLWSLLSVSDDGGRSFRILAPFRDVHPDYHAMWIDPSDPRHLMVGNDGGVAVSRDRGRTWRFVANLPLAQYYHVAVDRDVPYHVYGGMQDNGSWRGPSTVWENGGIRNHHWEEVGFGDGFDTRPDPEDSSIGYAMSQEGYLVRWNLRTGERKDIRPAPPAPEVELRFNWNAALAVDPFDPATIYYGSQFVHRSFDRGDTWTEISPDLTTDRAEWQKQSESGGLTPDVTGAENFTSIVALAPSPVERGVLWAGTDDGRVHVTRDGGKSWTSVEGRIRGVPEHTWVPHIEPSGHDGGTAFVVFDNHRRSDWTPYVFRTTDHGVTWKRLPTDGVRGYALSLAQDPLDPDLLFLGTEFGLWVSLDGGSSWLPWRHGVPTVSAMDVVVHPDTHDLVVGTHGRGVYVIDDIAPLREITAEVLSRPVHLFAIPDAQQYRVKQTGASHFPGHGEFRGPIRPYGALVTFSLSDDSLPSAEELERSVEQKGRERAVSTRPEPEPGPNEGEDEAGPKAEIVVFDADGAKVRRFEERVHRGVNRVVWNLRRDPYREPPREEPWWREERGGPEVQPGEYTVEVRYGEHSARGAVRVLPDPRFDVSKADRRAKWEAIDRAGRLQEVVAEAVARILEVRADSGVVIRKLDAARRDAGGGDEDEPEAHARLREAARVLDGKLAELERKLWVPPKTRGIEAEADVLSKLARVMGSLTGSWDRPSPAQTTYLELAGQRLAGVLEDVNALFEEDVAAFRDEVRSAGVGLLPEETPLSVDEGT